MKPVIQTFINESEKLIRVFVGGKEIVATAEHPFYVDGRGWTEAKQLCVRDILVLQDGSRIPIEKVQYEMLASPVTVYNFEVADWHTYYVGENSTLVHNANCANGGFKKYSSSELDKMVSDSFHGDGGAKKAILKDVSTDILKKVGNNPDIYINKEGIIQLVSTKYKGVSVITDLNINWY